MVRAIRHVGKEPYWLAHLFGSVWIGSAGMSVTVASDVGDSQPIEVRRLEPTVFVAYLGGSPVGRCKVAIGTDMWEFYSTNVESEYEGRGIASVLVREALTAAQAANVQVVASCWYVEGWLDRHPEYQNLRGERVAADRDDSICRIAPSIVKPTR